MVEQDNENEQMRCALEAIANEMQKFHTEPLATDDILSDEDDSDLVSKYKKCLKLKKEQVKMLRHNLKSACIVAKTLSAAKAHETSLLNNELNSARNQYLDLVKQDKEKTNMISALKAENQTLQDKLQCFNNFIRLGYQGLQNIHNESLESIENTSSLKQLQTIIQCCNQYYADEHNKFEKCSQLEQKNRFLTSKLRILESQLQTTLEELRSLRGSTKRSCKEKEETSEEKKRTCKTIGMVYSEYQIGHNKLTNLKMSKLEYKGSSHDQRTINNKMCNLDLTRHLSTVRKLLHDQDSLIKDLKCLSNEINSETFLS